MEYTSYSDKMFVGSVILQLQIAEYVPADVNNRRGINDVCGIRWLVCITSAVEHAIRRRIFYKVCRFIKSKS